MKTSLLALFVGMGLLLDPSLADEGSKKADFLIDQSKHYVYLKFDHIADREPLTPDEPRRGLWLRLVNNCRIPILVAILDTGPENPGVGVFDEVVPVVLNGAVPVLSLPHPKRGAPSKPASRSQEEPPKGYSPPDVFSTTTISPGEDLLFNLPLNHVGPSWYLQVRFYFQLPGEGYGSGPYSVVSFDWQDIPEGLRQPESARVPPRPTTH